MKIKLTEPKNKVEITFWLSVPVRLEAALPSRSNLEAMRVLNKKLDEIADDSTALEYWFGRGLQWFDLRVLDMDCPEVSLVLVDHVDDNGDIIEAAWLSEQGRYAFFCGNPGTAATEAAMAIEAGLLNLLDGNIECAKTELATWLKRYGNAQNNKVKEYIGKGERCEHIQK